MLLYIQKFVVLRWPYVVDGMLKVKNLLQKFSRDYTKISLSYAIPYLFPFPTRARTNMHLHCLMYLHCLMNTNEHHGMVSVRFRRICHWWSIYDEWVGQSAPLPHPTISNGSLFDCRLARLNWLPCFILVMSNTCSTTSKPVITFKTSLCLCLSVSVRVCLSVCLSLSRSARSRSLSLPLALFACLCLSVCLYVGLSLISIYFRQWRHFSFLKNLAGSYFSFTFLHFCS